MRLIDADALMDYLQTIPIDLGYRGIEDVKRFVNKMPTIEERKMEWIPCSDTVDIPDCEVFACDKYGTQMIGFLLYEDEQWLCTSDDTMMYDPIAWMPLPSPYQAERLEE